VRCQCLGPAMTPDRPSLSYPCPHSLPSAGSHLTSTALLCSLAPALWCQWQGCSPRDGGVVRRAVQGAWCAFYQRLSDHRFEPKKHRQGERRRVARWASCATCGCWARPLVNVLAKKKKKNPKNPIVAFTTDRRLPIWPFFKVTVELGLVWGNGQCHAAPPVPPLCCDADAARGGGSDSEGRHARARRHGGGGRGIRPNTELFQGPAGAAEPGGSSRSTPTSAASAPAASTSFETAAFPLPLYGGAVRRVEPVDHARKSASVAVQAILSPLHCAPVSRLPAYFYSARLHALLAVLRGDAGECVLFGSTSPERDRQPGVLPSGRQGQRWRGTRRRPRGGCSRASSGPTSWTRGAWWARSSGGTKEEYAAIGRSGPDAT